MVSEEIAEIGLAVDAIKAEVASGRQQSAEDIKARAERLNALSARLATVRAR
jgi:hypothetical protein